MLCFAYPNVIPENGRLIFIGCGRYAAFLPDDIPGPGYETAKPNTPNLRTVEHTAEIMAPESFESERMVYESKDEPKRTYQGNSLDLAYLLALAGRCRDPGISGRERDYDIWCTGKIELGKDNKPHLFKVEENGFDVKLKAFLSEKNQDNLFIVPTANITAQHIRLCEEKGARLISLRKFDPSKHQDIFEKKTVFRVLGSDIELLTDTIFEKLAPDKPSSMRPDIRRLIFGLIMLLVLLTGIYCWHTYDQETLPDIPEIAETGDFHSVKEKLNALGQTREADFLKLWVDKSVLRIGETVSYHFQSERDCYLVLLNMTSGGDLVQLFPNKYHPNRLIQAYRKYSIPGDQPLQLKVTGPPGKEDILALVSRESPVGIVPTAFALLEGNKDDPVVLKQMITNIQEAEKLNLAHKRITYSILPEAD